MTTETTATETKTETIATQQENVVTPAQTTEVDYEAVLAQKDAALAQVAQEKENYRKAYLKVSKPEVNQTDTDEPEELEALIDRKVSEKLLNTKEAQLQAEKDQALKAVLKRNKELETALKAREGVTSVSGTGSNQEKPAGKNDNFFSNEQIASLRAKGYDDKKIETLKKNMQNPPTMRQ